ncbi:hypothetical protein TNCV_4227221 [Trichonephila clavipes]|nr:hypothetical protein TNCV_4227221 [Trichonephila clavipes]
MTREHLSACPALLHVLSQNNCGVLLPARATSALYWTARRLMSERTLADEVDQYSTFVRGLQFTIDALKASGLYDTETPYVKELLNSLYEFTDLHHQVVSEFSSFSPCSINGCPHQDYPSSTPSIMILDNVNNENNCNNDINMETEKSLPTKSKEKSNGFIMPPHSKVSKINDIDNQSNFQIELVNKFSVLSQETA